MLKNSSFIIIYLFFGWLYVRSFFSRQAHDIDIDMSQDWWAILISHILWPAMLFTEIFDYISQHFYQIIEFIYL